MIRAPAACSTTNAFSPLHMPPKACLRTGGQGSILLLAGAQASAPLNIASLHGAAIQAKEPAMGKRKASGRRLIPLQAFLFSVSRSDLGVSSHTCRPANGRLSASRLVCALGLPLYLSPAQPGFLISLLCYVPSIRNVAWPSTDRAECKKGLLCPNLTQSVFLNDATGSSTGEQCMLCSHLSAGSGKQL